MKTALFIFPRSGALRRALSTCAAIAFLTTASNAAPVTVPIEFKPSEITFNFQSFRGVPISTTNNATNGFDGRLPTANESFGSVNPATTNQFKTLLSFGSIPAPTNWLTLSNSSILEIGTNTFSPLVAEQMQLPVGRSNNTIAYVLRRAQIGAPFVSQQVSFLFGSVIPVPETDENGAMLTNIVKEQYWFAEPHTTNGHTNAAYYWSPHAQKVYAIQPGQITITWKKIASTTTVPPGYTNGHPDYVVSGGNYFRLRRVNYIVSGSAVQTPRKIYWTEKSFQSLGKVVEVPAARVGAVNIVYNNSFPRTVPSEFVVPGQTSPTDGTTNGTLAELRTLWFDDTLHGIHAYNREGRVFVELLGDTRTDGQTREQLGFEIVDVFKQVAPLDVDIELGERITPPAPGNVNTLSPEPVLQTVNVAFAHQHSPAGSDDLELYAVRETQNLNDYMVHWMETGEVGLKWPRLLGRYRLIWPTDVSRYSHYVRPLVATENEAKETAVPLSTENVPIIEYQDPLDQPRAKLTEEYKFYTFLNTTYSAHRTLLRFSSGENIAFERVFSWLDTTLKAPSGFANTLATNLDSWIPTNNSFSWPDAFVIPRIFVQNVEVGQRISAPIGETGSAAGEDYFAGYIRQALGNSFNPTAYIDPFISGFEDANLGAIIPVNSIPGANKLEVWWFRANRANAQLGFKTIHWPSVISTYTINWPSAPREIILASNKGSAGDGVNDPLVALGTIYSQNNPSLPGYNPNEEHAIMSGGSAFALRDDLNITSGGSFSSLPYVLVDYKMADDRPAMAVYKILREKPEAGILFDYVVKAGMLLQAPMPLPLMTPPTEGSGDSTINYNTETSGAGGDVPGGWNDATDSLGVFAHYKKFTYRDRKQGFWVYRGLHTGLPALQAGRYNVTNRTFGALSAATAVVGQPFAYFIHASRQDEYLTLSAQPTSGSLPAWLSANGLSLRGTPAASDVGILNLKVVVRDVYDGAQITNDLSLTVLASGSVVAQGSLHLLSTNNYTGSIVDFTNRPPFLASSPVPSNSFTMRFYYKTEASFDWPGMSTPPPVGSIVPYLRPLTPGTNTYVGDAASKTTASLDIVYRPVWPVLDPKDSTKVVPTIPYGQTLTAPVNGLPGVRDFKTARVLYQQSIASNITTALSSVVLHDPTREKIADLATHGFDKLPSGIQTDSYQGRFYFPKLPPHLESRMFFDPNRGSKGSLVFQGEFKDEVAGQKYVLLNVLRDADLTSVKALCPQGPDYAGWATLVDGLATTVQTFHENPNVPGTYIANQALDVSVKVGELAAVNNDNIAVDSYALSATGPGSGYITLLESGGTAFTSPGDPVSMHVMKVGGSLYTGELKPLAASNPLSEEITMQHTGDQAGRAGEYQYQWKIASPVDGLPPVPDATMSRYLSLTNGSGVIYYTIGGAGVQALSDNYVTMRYRPTNPNHPLYKANPTDADWSEWTTPKLAEGWIKRVLAGINPFNQRTTDLFNNRANTDVSIISQAGWRWEGDVALNVSTLNNYGLIEIYETVLRRGRGLTIESGFNYGPANDALLLAAGYLNDLYMMLGNEAWADASNPTIGIGTADNTYGDISTALFSFKGQQASLLEEELSLLRGRDDFLQPGVETAPFYNRLVWNYTRGIDSGEVIYALNYNILDQNNDGAVNASDAAKLFPQAHGDAYGHYLTALEGYYSLLMNPNFDWVPRIEAVSILGQPVSVDYLDERKFAAAAAAVARAGRQVFDLTWRQDYQPGNSGWNYLSTNRVNPLREFTTTSGGATNSVRYWGLDHWGARVGQGSYLNWVVGNAILPAVDPNPTHEGIQKVDRTTVPELDELVSEAENLQLGIDNAEGGMTPLGLSPGSIAFDVNPNQITGTDGGTHFEQVYQRAKVALNNAVAAFDDAKDVTRLMRSEDDSLADFKNSVHKQEMAYTNVLIELYGTPYPEDIGAGKLYPQGYAGPDMFHFPYVEMPELNYSGLLKPGSPNTVAISITSAPTTPLQEFVSQTVNYNYVTAPPVGTINFTFDSYGSFIKPSTWTSQRVSPGRMQEAIIRIFLARNAALEAVNRNQSLQDKLDRAYTFFNTKLAVDTELHQWDDERAIAATTVESVAEVGKIAAMIFRGTSTGINRAAQAAINSIPTVTIAGTAVGGDLYAPARGIILANAAIASTANDKVAIIKEILTGGLKVAKDAALRQRQVNVIDPMLRDLESLPMAIELDNSLDTLQSTLFTINARLIELDDAMRHYQALIAEGNRIQMERQAFRQRAAAVIQGYRTRDAAFRLFRNEKLERYKTLFDLSARYSFLAANAYDYETGLLNTDEGRAFINRIINSRALGVVRNGEPQYAGGNTGDPGLSSVLAEMKADWDVLRGRLGFNNPDAYGTTASLRMENYRIMPDTNGLAAWQDVLHRSKMDNLLDDADVRRYCMQIAPNTSAAVPGFIFEFSTTIGHGFNVFGHPLAAGDHAYSPSAFATKIFGAGVALEGYRGMDNPSANSVVTSSGGTSPSEPNTWYLDPLALSATPYIYLIPVGVDAMRSPPLGDNSEIRSWSVDDVAVPLPFNIGASDFSTRNLYTTSDSLTEPLFSIRKHQSFRPVPSASFFSTSLYGPTGTLQRSQYTNNRLVARSVWNTKWKLVIPGYTLLNDPKAGMDRFTQTVTDIKLHFVTYSYSGN